MQNAERKKEFVWKNHLLSDTDRLQIDSEWLQADSKSALKIGLESVFAGGGGLIARIL